MWNPSTCNCECNKASKIDEYLNTKNVSREKHLFGKLVLACEDEILNTTEKSLADKKVTFKKNVALFLLFYWLLYGCYYYFSFQFVVIFIIQNIGQNKKIYYRFTTPTIN